MTSSTTNEAFQDAYEKFLDSLPKKEQARYSPCISADDILDGLGKLEVLSTKRQKSRSRSLIRHVKEFSDRLQPYFDAVGTLAQGNQYACIAWGSLLLVLQLASNFSSFFEKLVQLIRQLSDAFPQYGEIASLPSICRSGRMKRHLEGVYGTLFQFFQSVAQIFTKPDGSIRRRTTVAYGLFWTPFDVRFKSVLDQMKYYKEIIGDELSIAQALAASKSEEAAAQERLVAEKERCHTEKTRLEINALSGQTKQLLETDEKRIKDEMFRQIHRWLRPGECTEVFQKSCDIREEGTCHWIWNSPKFRDWRSGEWCLRGPITKKKNALSANVLWVHGNPGSGKTILASSVVEELESHILASDVHPTVCYYFFSSEGPNSLETTRSSSAYRAILAQILQQHKNDTVLMEKLAFSTSNGTAQLHASTAELIDLLSLCSQHVEHIYLVLDGIDECDNNADIIRTLGIMTTYSPLKIILFSRVNVPCLSKTVVPMQRLPVDTSALSVDIGCYLSRCLASLIEDDLLLPTEIPNLVDHLVRGADGMFLWAKLMVNYLNSPALTPAKRLETIQHVIFPEGLEKMYDRILVLIGKQGKTEQNLARNIFAWLTYSKAPLTIQQLYEATHMGELNKEAGASYQDASFREAIDVVCGSLVECRAPKHASRNKFSITDVLNNQEYEDEFSIKFIHLSIKEHFTQVYTSPLVVSGDSPVPREPEVHFDLTRRCLQSLLSVGPQDTHQTSRFARYSVIHWVDHISDCTKTDLRLGDSTSSTLDDTLRQFCSILSDLLENPKAITSWLSSYFTHTDPFSGQDLPLDGLKKWSNWSENLNPSSGIAQELRNLSQPIAELFGDIQELTDTWGEKLREYPRILWDEVSAFINSRFLHTNYVTKVTSLAPKATEDPLRSSRPLCTISTTSADSTINAVLSVWPSRQYEERWRGLKSNEAISRVHDVCSDWLVRYELWNIQTKKSIVKIRVPLDEGEVWLHMRQSLYEKDVGDWSTSFPMVISNDVLCFVVLRTVFVFYVTARAPSQATYQQVVLPMDFLGSHTRRWSDALTAFDPLNNKIRDLPLKWIYRDRYRYSIELSPNGRYLSFVDYEVNSNLAVFEILRESTLKLELLINISVGFLCRDGMKTVFHPWADCIFLVSQSDIQLWEFRKGQTAMSCLQKYSYRALPSISMSSCGKFLVVMEEVAPTVITLPDLPPCDVVPDKQIGSKEAECQDLKTLGSRDISEFRLRPGQSLNNASVVNCRDGKVSSVVTVTSGDEPTIRLTGTGQSDQAVKLMSLPPSVEMTHTTSTIIFPERGDDPLRIAVNMKSTQEYSMSGLPDRRLPALIERDVRSLKQISTSTNTRELRDLTVMPAEEPQYQALATGPAANSIFNSTFVGMQDTPLPPLLAPKYGSLKRKPSTLEALISGEPPQKR